MSLDTSSFEVRQKEYEKISQKYPDRIPVIVNRSNKSDPDIDKKKYLVPKEISMAEFTCVIRRRIKLDPSQALFIFINNSLPRANELISEVYQREKSKDGFLYIHYTLENTFG